MMRIVNVTYSLDPVTGGGTGERTRRISLALAAQGVECQVVSMFGGRWADELSSAGVATRVAGSIGRGKIPLINPVGLYRQFRRADIVHVTGYWNLLSALSCVTAWAARRPYVLCTAGELAALREPALRHHLLHRLLGRRLLRNASGVIAITPLEVDDLKQHGVEASRIVIVPNGITPPRELGTRQRRAGGRRILFVGRLARNKGPDLLIEAFATIADAFPDSDLLVAGPDFGMERELRDLTRRHGLEGRVRFLGYLDEAARTQAILDADLLAIPSRDEAMSLVVLEAGILGCPVLLTDRCGFDEVARVDGGMVVAATAAGLAEGLRVLLAPDRDLPAMGQRLERLIRSDYTWDTIIARLLWAFRDITMRGRLPNGCSAEDPGHRSTPTER